MMQAVNEIVTSIYHFGMLPWMSIPDCCRANNVFHRRRVARDSHLLHNMSMIWDLNLVYTLCVDYREMQCMRTLRSYIPLTRQMRSHSRITFVSGIRICMELIRRQKERRNIMILCLRCMLSGVLISSNVMTYAVWICRQPKKKYECCRRQLKNAVGRLFLACPRDRLRLRKRGIMKRMRICGVSQMISGMTGSYLCQCLNVASFGRAM